MELLLVAILVFIIFMWALSGRSRRRRGGRRSAGRRYPRVDPSRATASAEPRVHRYDESRLADPTAQMEFVSRVDFEPRRLLNKSEYVILKILEETIRNNRSGHRVMAQTSLGEVIKTSSGSGPKRIWTSRFGRSTASAWISW